MLEFLQSTPAQAVIWVAALMTFGAVGLYVIKLIRQWSDTDGEHSSNELLTHFRGMHDEGDISKTEFKRIKSVLGGKLQHELDSNDADGDDQSHQHQCIARLSADGCADCSAVQIFCGLKRAKYAIWEVLRRFIARPADRDATNRLTAASARQMATRATPGRLRIARTLYD